MRLLFAGTPEIARQVLEQLIPHHEIVGVLTQPDRPLGRGQKLEKSPVKQLAEKHPIPVFQPLSLGKDPQIKSLLSSLQPDLLIVVAYGLILPESIFSIPRFGAWNIHTSLLPRWRGAAPIQRAIEAGDTQTGVSLMQMDSGLDTGDILLQKTCPISLEDTSETIHQKLASLGSAVLLEALAQREKLLPQTQSTEGICYAHKLEKAEGLLDWSLSAKTLHDKIRAFYPWPICFSHLQGQVIRVWASALNNQKQNSLPGTLVIFQKNRLGVVCAEGQILELIKLQLPAKKALSAAELLNGHRVLFEGTRFE